VGEKREKVGFTIKIGLNKPSLLHYFFFDAKKVIVIIHSVA